MILVHDLPYGAESEFLARIVPPLEAPYDFGAFGEVNMQLNAGILALTQDYATVEDLMSSAQRRWRKPKAGKVNHTRREPRRVSSPKLLHVHLREFHFAVLHDAGAARQLVTEPDQQEQRNADVGRGHAVPVDLVLQEGLVVLAQGNDQAQHEGEDRPQRKNPERYGKSFRSRPCSM